MSAKLWKTATSNAFNTTLNGSITADDETITLTTTAGLQAPGVVVIDRVDANNEATPASREYVSFTGISSNNLTGCTRGLGGSSAQAHSSGAKVEEALSVTHWNDLVDFLNETHDSAGRIATSALATIAQARIYTHLNASGASISGSFPIHPVWKFTGTASTPTINQGDHVPMPQGGAWNFFTVTLNGPASGATLVIDINKNNESIFEEAFRPMVPAGGTFISTASISVPGFNQGDFFSVDLDSIGDTINDLSITVLGRSG